MHKAYWNLLGWYLFSVGVPPTWTISFQEMVEDSPIVPSHAVVNHSAGFGLS